MSVMFRYQAAYISRSTPRMIFSILGVIILFCSLWISLALYSDIVNTTTWKWTLERLVIAGFVITNFYGGLSLLRKREQVKLQRQHRKKELAWKTIRKFLLSFAKVDPKL